MKNAIRVIILVVVTALFFNPAARAQFFFLQNENVGKEAKDFTLKRLHKEKASLNDVRDGKKAVVFFWATWCPHCRQALGELNRERQEIEKKDIRIVLVDVGETEQIVGRYMEKNKIEMDVFLDEESEVAGDYGLIGVPTFYFIDEKGIVTDVQHGLPEDLEAVFAEP